METNPTEHKIAVIHSSTDPEIDDEPVIEEGDMSMRLMNNSLALDFTINGRVYSVMLPIKSVLAHVAETF